ncbi:bifunctional adenosylcobinamide kinase/adenosylcobinamide-phosphate guanylyltransferase [Bacillus sp. FJAT-29790]|uniref:bifunctional adenosylcobinamide kinase/adenosylcobinamide-phosphate guanylyltransferase n=1 Tax=Bacillus sp. FJAT-29790 TaxID=1895002 RepID=UPI001C230179|nr:bifunctional adenosylcobinamide kinase/adenosylcobinamide-phosphate guanylyltransferase [Bacillus sp. FJAT-29790]MBU8879906.1 bifunctional adenosylcobinamide kinase/adenosylcobinamide-phosphate guanylyltransferase [Bacillus sp. FJAT-29790]
MHFVTGGAFNGKTKWVRETYQLKETPHLWFSAYKGNHIPDCLSEYNGSRILILEGIEIWLKDWANHLDVHEIRERWRKLLQTWLEWEKEGHQRKIILIGTDITKGIVPMLAEERKWRDVTGWVYQDAAAAAERADLIWYGIGQQIK